MFCRVVLSRSVPFVFCLCCVEQVSVFVLVLLCCPCLLLCYIFFKGDWIERYLHSVELYCITENNGLNE